MNLRPQFSVWQLLVVLTVYSLLFAGVARLPVGLMAIAVAVTTAFVALDLCGVTASAGAPRWSLVAVLASHYLTALAYAVAICAIVYFWNLQPLPQSGTWVEFKQALRDAFQQLAYIALSVAASALLSTLGGIAAIVAIRRFRWAVALLVANVPGMLLLAYTLLQTLVESVSEIR